MHEIFFSIIMNFFFFGVDSYYWPIGVDYLNTKQANAHSNVPVAVLRN